MFIMFAFDELCFSTAGLVIVGMKFILVTIADLEENDNFQLYFGCITSGELAFDLM